MSAAEYDVVVRRGGAPGEHCAGALAAGGLRVAVVERELLGGECSYWGCIPSKTLLRPGEALADARNAPGALEAVTGGLEVAAVLAWRDFQPRPGCARGVGVRRALGLPRLGTAGGSIRDMSVSAVLRARPPKR